MVANFSSLTRGKRLTKKHAEGVLEGTRGNAGFFFVFLRELVSAQENDSSSKLEEGDRAEGVVEACVRRLQK